MTSAARPRRATSPAPPNSPAPDAQPLGLLGDLGLGQPDLVADQPADLLGQLPDQLAGRGVGRVRRGGRRRGVAPGAGRGGAASVLRVGVVATCTRCHAPTARPGKSENGSGVPGARRPATWLASLAAMTWHWRLEDPAGAAIDPATLGVEMPETDNQGDAESWLGENWRELLDRGVATVTLFDGDDEVYGPMGLAAP